MQTTTKITPDDYPDLLAAVDEGISQRELARRYGCAPSLVARHLSKARRARDLSTAEGKPETDPSIRPIERSAREIVEALIRDPKTSARDVASLTNALTRMNKEEEPGALDLSIFPFRRGTLILEPGPGPGSEHRFRLMQRMPGGIAHSSGGDYDLTAKEALYLVFCALGSELGLTPEDLGLAPEDVAAAAKRG
jgi:hypothetical protein